MVISFFSWESLAKSALIVKSRFFDEYCFQFSWSCSFLGKEMPPLFKACYDHGLIAFSFLLPHLYVAYCSASQALGAFQAFKGRCSLLLGFLKVKNIEYGYRWVLLLCSPLFSPLSSSFLHLKSQTGPSAGISVLAPCCQRAGLFFGFSAGFMRIFVGCSHKVALDSPKNFSDVDFLAGSLGIMVVLKKHLWVKESLVTWVDSPSGNKPNAAVGVLLCSYGCVTLKPVSLRDPFLWI